MRSFTCIASLLALGGTAASATKLLIPAHPRAEGLGKRDVQCGGGVFCPDDYVCITGSDGQPGCCPVG